MAVLIGSLYVSLQANVAPFAQGMNRATAVTAAATQRISRNAAVAERSVNSFWGGVQGRGQAFRPYSLIAVSRAFETTADRSNLLRGSLLATTAVFGGFAAALGSNVLLRYIDTFTNLQNQLRTVTNGTADLVAVQESLVGVAQRSRSSLQATATIYARTARAAEFLGTSQEDLLRITETIQKAFAVGGATTAEAFGAAVQLSQGIASDRFSGEEFRSVAENAPVLLRGIAQSLGVTIGKLREMAHAGQLTAAVVTKAILDSNARIEEEFSRTVITVDRAITQVDNQLIEYVGAVDKAYGITQLLSQGIAGFGAELDQILPTLGNIIALLAAVGVARNKALVGGLVGGAGGAFLGNELGGPSGALIGAGLGGLLGFRGASSFNEFRAGARAAKDEVRDLTGRVGDLRKEFLAAADARRAALIASRGDPFLAARPAQLAAVSRVALNPRATITDIQSATAVARIAGQKKLADEVERTTTAYKAVGRAYETSKTQLAALAKSATIAGQAKAFLGRQALSLVGLFGGPWGVAITAGIGLLTYLGIQSRRTAQEIANAEKLIASELETLAEAGDQQAQRSVLQLRLEELEKSKKTVDDYIANIRRAIKEPILTPGTDPFFTRRLQIAEFGPQVLALADQLKRGEISVAEFNGKLSVIDQHAPKIRSITDAARENAEKISLAGQALDSLGNKVDDLRAKLNEPMEIRFRIAFEGRAGDEQRFAPSGAFAAFDKERQEATREILNDLDDKIRVARLNAQGLTAEAEAQKIVNDAREDGKFVDEAAILAKVRLLEQLEKEASALKKAGTAAETLAEKIARLRAESGGAFLPDIDRQVVEQARGLKVAADVIDRYIAAVRSGDLSQAPPLLAELREWELFDRAAESARGLIQQYGTFDQITPLVTAKQRELAIAVANGAITMGQAKLALADYLATFQNYQWIDDLSTAIGDFLKDAILDFDNLGQTVANFTRRLAEMALQILTIEPLVRALKSTFGDLAAGSGGGGFVGFLKSAASLLIGGGSLVSPSVGVFHGGGIVGRPSVTRPVPISTFVGAPSFHDGLRTGERAGIFKIGEEILNRETSQREMGIVAGLSHLASGAGSGDRIVVHAPITIEGGSTGDPEDDAKLAKQVATMVKTTVIAEITNQKREAGLLNQRFGAT